MTFHKMLFVLVTLVCAQAYAEAPRFDRNAELEAANAAIEAGDYENAYRHLQRLHSLEPSTARWLSLSARAQFERGKLALAEQKASDALALNRADVEALLVMGEIRVREGRWAEAQYYYRRATKADKTSLAAYRGLAITEYQLGNDEAGEAASVKASSLR